MYQLSENCSALEVEDIELKNLEGVSELNPIKPNVWFFILPYSPKKSSVVVPPHFVDNLRTFIDQADEGTVVCFLSNSQTSSDILMSIQKDIFYKLWVSVRCEVNDNIVAGLPRTHSEVIIFGKYKESLKHTKTRIPYTYCPACGKTTKDYGGKKHTYHQYGTLMSDVWRDICVKPDRYPSMVVNRLKHLFGLVPYEKLYVVNMLEAFEYKNEFVIKKAYGKETCNDIGKNMLLNGDAISILKDIPDNSVDYCFADPPYNLEKEYDNCNDALQIEKYFQWCDRWLLELKRVIRPGRVVTVLNIPLWAARHYQCLSNILDYHSWIVWDALSLPVRNIMPANYSIISFSKGPLDVSVSNNEMSLKDFFCSRYSCIKNREEDKRLITDIWSDIHRLKHNSRRHDHPCQLPPALMKRLISLFTKEKDVVLDPFNGVGTTTLSAQQLNRGYIGIEISDKYHNIAKNRHEDAYSGLDPFRKTSFTPSTKNNRVPRAKKQRYEVPKKYLQLEVKRIAIEIGRLPTKEEVRKMSKYSFNYYNEYFNSWGEVCAAARAFINSSKV